MLSAITNNNKIIKPIWTSEISLCEYNDNKRYRMKGLVKKESLKSVCLSEKTFHIKKVLSNAKSLKSLTWIFNENDVSNSTINHFKLLLQRSQRLTFVKLKIPKNFFLDREFHGNWKYLRKLKWLESFSMKLKKSTDNFERFSLLSPLVKVVSKLSSLREFYFTSKGHGDIGKQDIELLLKGVVNIGQLETISLNFRWCQSLGDVEIQEIGKFVSKNHNIKTFLCDLGWCKKLTDQGLLRLLGFIKKFNSLECLGLNLSGCSLISDKGIEHLSQTLVKIKNLSELAIDLSNYARLTRDGFISFAECLKQINKLRNFKMNCAFNISPGYVNSNEAFTEIDDQVMESFASSLEKLSNLKYLAFDVGWCEGVTGSGIRDMMYSFTALPDLQELAFEISGVSGSKSVKFYEELEFSCLSLKKVKIDVSFNQVVDDEFQTTLGYSFCDLHEIKDFSVDFSKCAKTSDKGIIGLSTIFEHLSNLEKVSLQIGGNPKLNDNCIQELSCLLGKIISLRTVNLNLQGSNINDETISVISKNLAQLRSLQDLTLNFVECYNITQDALKGLVDAIAQLRFLRNIHIYFSETASLYQIDVALFRQAIARLPRLVKCLAQVGNKFIMEFA